MRRRSLPDGRAAHITPIGAVSTCLLVAVPASVDEEARVGQEGVQTRLTDARSEKLHVIELIICGIVPTK